MGLVVPILRIAMVFLNVYESFKTLKPPPASTRIRGRASIRGKTQRKRDMKGCLAVWIVWCCFVSYERFLERVVSLFIPFYDEMKSMVLLFLIFTRARGAEPIYLHVIRPLLKPYTATLDLCLDATCMIGDMIYTVSMMPVQSAFSWWRQFSGSKAGYEEIQTKDNVPTEAQSLEGSSSRVSRTSNGRANGRPVATRAPVPRQQSRSHIGVASSQASTSRRYPASEITRPGFPPARAQTTGAAQAAKVPNSRPTNPRSISQPQARPSSQRKLSGSISEPQPEVWTPPPSYHDSDDEEGLPAFAGSAATPHASIPSLTTPTISGLPSDVQEQVDEWRKYPPLPAAYPPTPLVTTVSLKSHVDDEISQSPIPSIAEEPDLADNMTVDDDVFRASGDASSVHVSPDTDEETESDLEDSEPEDAFNVSLRTPRSRRTIGASTVYNDDDQIASSASSSSSSIHTRSTTLDTIDNASSLRTSDSEDGSSSIAHYKRARPHGSGDTADEVFSVGNATSKVPDGRSTIRARPKRQASAHMIAVSQQQIIRSMSTSVASDDDSDSPPAADDISVGAPATKAKRRKVVVAKKPSAVSGARTTRAATKALKPSSTSGSKARGTLDKARSTVGTRASKQPAAPPIRPTQPTGESDGPQPRSQRTVRNR